MDNKASSRNSHSSSVRKSRVPSQRPSQQMDNRSLGNNRPESSMVTTRQRQIQQTRNNRQVPSTVTTCSGYKRSFRLTASPPNGRNVQYGQSSVDYGKPVTFHSVLVALSRDNPWRVCAYITETMNSAKDMEKKAISSSNLMLDKDVYYTRCNDILTDLGEFTVSK